MKSRMLTVLAAGAAVTLLASCGGSSNPSTPTAVATPVPTPTPTATPTPAPAFVSVRLKITGFTRAGIHYTFPPSAGRPGDDIELDASPLDASGRETPNHPMNIEWYPGSNGGYVEGVHYDLEHADTFDPVIHLRANGAGFIEIYCRLSGVQSNVLHIDILDH